MLRSVTTTSAASGAAAGAAAGAAVAEAGGGRAGGGRGIGEDADGIAAEGHVEDAPVGRRSDAFTVDFTFLHSVHSNNGKKIQNRNCDKNKMELK